jgi:putative transposase
MSVTREGPGSAGMVRTAAEAGVLVAEAARYGGDGSTPAGRRLAPLRELIDDRLLDALLERSRDEAGGLRLTGEGSMLGEMVRAVLERALEAELTAHLGYARHDPSGHNSGNSRNGMIRKKVQTGIGPVPIEVPRDRAGAFEPLLVPKRSGRISGGRDDMIISLYAHVRDERPRHPAPLAAGVRHRAVGRDRVPDHRRRPGRGPGLAEPAAGPGLPGCVPSRHLGRVRDNHVVQSKPAYLAAGTGADGEKHVLGIWLARTPLESATAGEGEGQLSEPHRAAGAQRALPATFRF